MRVWSGQIGRRARDQGIVPTAVRGELLGDLSRSRRCGAVFVRICRVRSRFARPRRARAPLEMSRALAEFDLIWGRIDQEQQIACVRIRLLTPILIRVRPPGAAQVGLAERPKIWPKIRRPTPPLLEGDAKARWAKRPRPGRGWRTRRCAAMTAAAASGHPRGNKTLEGPAC